MFVIKSCSTDQFMFEKRVNLKVNHVRRASRLTIELAPRWLRCVLFACLFWMPLREYFADKNVAQSSSYYGYLD